MSIVRTYEQSELPQIAQTMLMQAAGRKIWLFDAPMGAGKTTLIKAVASLIGVQDIVSSPTFGIVNEYSDAEGRPVYHFDCYRLADEDEALAIGIEEYFDSGNYCWVEWPSKVANLLPDDAFYVEIVILGETQRQIALH